MGGSNIILVLLIIVQATRHRLNLPALPPIRRAITIILLARRVRLAHIPVFTAPKLPGMMPISLKANRLQGQFRLLTLSGMAWFGRQEAAQVNNSDGFKGGAARFCSYPSLGHYVW